MRKSTTHNDPSPLSNSLDRAAARLGLGKSMLYVYINSGELRSFKVGKRRLVLETELQRFLAKISGGAEAVQ